METHAFSCLKLKIKLNFISICWLTIDPPPQQMKNHNNCQAPGPVRGPGQGPDQGPDSGQAQYSTFNVRKSK